MGFFGDAVRQVRELTRGDKEFAAAELARGNTTASSAAGGFDLLQAYGYDVLSDYLRLEQDLMSRYLDYEEMDDYPEISAALDIYADDATVPDTQRNRSLWVESADRTTQEVLDDLFHKRLRFDDEIEEIARTLCKYGNDFEELLVTDEGVVGLNFLPPATVRRVEGRRGELYGFVQDFRGKTSFSPVDFQRMLATKSSSGSPVLSRTSESSIPLEDWEVVHFRLRGKQRRSLYGHSVMEPSRWIWKRLMLLEDAALIYRLQRAPERYAFYVDTGDLPPKEALAYTNQCRQMYRKKKFYNASTGGIDLRNNPLSQDDDFYIPVRKGSDAARVEVLGSPSWQHMDDIEYFLSKLFAGMKVPKAYLAQEGEVARAVLSSQDVRFARSVLRIQRELRNGSGKIARVHLAATGVDPNQVDFDIRMTVPSAIFELAQLEVRSARADLAGRMKEFVSLEWLLTNVFQLNDSDVQDVIKARSAEAIADGITQGEAQAQGELVIAKLNPPPAEESVGSRFRYRSASGISEQELTAGSREGEKKAADMLEQLLENDKGLAARLESVKGLLWDLRDSKASPNSRRFK